VKLEAQVQGKTVSIELEQGDDGVYRIVLDQDKVMDIDAVCSEHDTWSLIIDGVSYEAIVQKLKDSVRVTIQGFSWDIDIEDPRHRRSKAKGGGAVEGAQSIISPMPGRIIKLEAQVGDAVEQGQGLVIVEAMKMENELAAEVKGTIKEIRCKEGEAVEEGQVLVVIESM
jgi:biotin carboxyl carrier protein